MLQLPLYGLSYQLPPLFLKSVRLFNEESLALQRFECSFNRLAKVIQDIRILMLVLLEILIKLVKGFYLISLVEEEYLEFEFLEGDAALNDGLVLPSQLLVLQFEKELIVSLPLVWFVGAGYFELGKVRHQSCVDLVNRVQT